MSELTAARTAPSTKNETKTSRSWPAGARKIPTPPTAATTPAIWYEFFLPKVRTILGISGPTTKIVPALSRVMIVYRFALPRTLRA